MAHPIQPIEERRLLGIGLAMSGYILFTVLDASAKWLSHSGMPVGEVVFIRYAVQFMLVMALFAPREGRALVASRRPWLEVWRGLAILTSTAFNFLALVYLPLTITSAISFTMPLITCAISVPLLRETVGWRRWLAILAGFVGVLIIVRPGTEAFHPAVLLSVASAACLSIYMLLTRKLSGVDSVVTMQFYSGLIATVCVAPFAIAGWVWPHDAAGWIAFTLIGLTAMIGHTLVTLASRMAPASVLAPFTYVQIIFMTAFSIILFGQSPDEWLFVGALIVIGSGLYIWLRERQIGKPVVTEVAAQD
ncbi:MAG: DMT family transporter [Devosia sp.]